jgi:hypothetical protein
MEDGMIKQNESTMTAVVLGLTIICGNFLLWTLYVVTAWRWFVVPLGAPALAYAHAAGLTGFVYLMTNNIHPLETLTMKTMRRDHPTLSEAWLGVLLGLGTAFGIGAAFLFSWMWHSMM